MEYAYISSSVAIKKISEDEKNGVFEISGLFAGYGLTVGNALRRALLSSLPGAAVTEIKVKNTLHEFSTIHGVKEDVVEIILNFKKLRFKLETDEPQVLLLKSKGEKIVTGADIKLNSDVELMNPESVIATCTSKDADFEVEITVERGLGYVPVEARKTEVGKSFIGTIPVDAIFTPVQKVNYTIEDMRVGDRTDYNRLKIEIVTDGTISPSLALHKAANILKDHFEKVSAIEVLEEDESKESAVKKSKKATK